MLRIKICGITQLEDALLSEKLGADAIGFVFFEKSPRNVSLDKAADISRRLQPNVAKVGVFVAPDPAFVERAVKTVGLDVVQIHGVSDPRKMVEYSHRPLIAAIPVKDESSVEIVAQFKPLTDAVLLDTYHPSLHGGTGKVFNWALGAKIARDSRIILAGGLTPENIQEAVETVNPYAVDISSGVEAAPGRKDHDKLTQFFNNLKEYRREWNPERNRLFPIA